MGAVQPTPGLSRIELANEPEFDLGGMLVKPPERAVEVAGERRELQPRVMQVLVALSKARSSVVSRDRLVDLCWNGRVVGDDAVNRIILSLRHLAREFSPEPFSVETIPRVGHRLIERTQLDQGDRDRAQLRSGRPELIALFLALLTGAFWFAFDPSNGGDPQPTVLVTAAEPDAASRELARDLAAKLGTLDQARHPPMRLIGGAEPSSERHDLSIEVKRSGGPVLVATLLLRHSSTQSVLWSKEFTEPSRNLADLKQQIAYTAAQVLRCALEGVSSKDRLGRDKLKTYLDACAALADLESYDLRSVVKDLEAVVEESPRFVLGWAKLLEADVRALEDPVFPEAAALKPAVKRHIVAARRIESDLTEAYLAETLFLPSTDKLGRGRLLDHAVARRPDHASARSFRSFFFMSVGRMGDAVREAREAVRLDPLSPILRDGYVSALVYSGQLEAARSELARTEKLWPGASSTIEAQYRVHLRYGDPKQALRMIRSGAIDSPIAPIQEVFAQARNDPSPENIERTLRQARTVHRDYPESIGNFAQTLAEFGRNEELIDLLLRSSKPDTVAMSAEILFRPGFADLHRDPRFMQVAKRAGLIRYWKATGNWPDLCYAPELPYDCKNEARKIGR